MSLEFEQAVEHLSSNSWPFPRVVQAVALAQHHGIPTRLLDFTLSPAVAAFFAAWSRFGGTEKAYPDARIALWAVNLWFIEHAWGSPAYLNRRVEVVTAPAADNEYLHRQRGFFMYLNDEYYRGEERLPPIDEVIVRCDRDPRSKAKLEGAGLHPRDYAPPLAYKITLPAEKCHDVLWILNEQDEIRMASLMPSLDNVTADLDFRRDRLLPSH